ncbi:radical SAM/Cys-rich domain protein [Mariprofundus erugo]|uniref:arsenosugar biosynthesis radical SAM (seleno)protein ArsS n=1 Tax=Mariprofundus erugo TaxID=2528639 RepID=UPI0010FD469C|nr:arsenosugar biosynthesis radical SAM (seleno)protein ArsS [Mariprofundus erugo]TLS75945.1 radical SAM/Cys-rich domain protein [Mariprofundus erugo]
MHEMLPLLKRTDFPAIQRESLDTLQVNLGYLCNQSCLHCHVNAGPRRTEIMSRENVECILEFLETGKIVTLDLTGGAPEMNPHFRMLVQRARALGVRVIDRCNLTILEEPEHGDLVSFLAAHGVEVVASLPCYLEDNVDAQRGKGVFERSIRALTRLNDAGYGHEGSGLSLTLVYNPQGPSLPPPQKPLEAAYKRELYQRYGIVFNSLFTITNMPIQRFGSMLVSRGTLDDYMHLLRKSFSEKNLAGVMCKRLISVDWQGYVYDCDFNQMLNLAMTAEQGGHVHLRDLIHQDIRGNGVIVMDHCYGCTAGQGSSCGGALER